MNIHRQLFALLCLLLFSVALSGCATSVRGASTDFVIQSPHEGVSVLLDLETRESRDANTWRDRRDAIEKKKPVPDFDFQTCEALPCTLNIPRKYAFTVLAVKDGYTPQIYEIAHVHKSQIDKLTNAGIVTGTAATIGGVGAVSAGLTLSGSAASVSTAVVGAHIFVIAAPATFLLVGANEIDKDNMANYDFYPNPLTIELQPLAPGAPDIPIDEILEAYRKLRIESALDPKKTGLCYYKSKRMSCWRLGKLEKRIERHQP